MCGICGICGPIEAGPPERSSLQAMCQALAHRGPDGSGLHLEPGLGLGHRRLSIIDLEGGAQPLSNEDASVWVVLNGEIYNYHELRRELEALGHNFRSDSDTETLVHLYEEHGPDMLLRLRGMFALAVWDARERCLLLARDRLGKKPLYYYEDGQTLVFASEPKAILRLPGFAARLDLAALDDYLSLQYVPDPKCIFAGIKKLPPGQMLLCCQGERRVESYFSPVYEPKLTASENELARELRYRLSEAVKVRLVSDVPLGAHLSGGLDSSLVVALMAGLSDRAVRTFSIGFSEGAFSELPKARLLAKLYGTEHHEFVVGHLDALATLREVSAYLDEPLADPSALPCHVLCRMTRMNVTVALNGDGGDEVFAGYQRYWLDPLADLYAKLPRALTGRLIPALLRLLPEPGGKPIESNWLAGLKRLEQAASLDRRASIARWGSYFSPQMKKSLFKPEYYEAGRSESALRLLIESFEDARAISDLDRTLNCDVRRYLPGDLLVKADRTAMANALEGRSPLLDSQLFAWAARLPDNLKLRGRNGKYLLKKACADLLPPEIINQGKQGFGLPVGKWFREGLRDFARETLLDGPLCRELFARSELERLLTEHQGGRVDHGKRLYALVMLELWAANFLPRAA